MIRRLRRRLVTGTMLLLTIVLVITLCLLIRSVYVVMESESLSALQDAGMRYGLHSKHPEGDNGPPKKPDQEDGSTGCSHSYSANVTTAASCTASGIKTYTCSLCGDSYTEVIPATGHSYANGSCTGEYRGDITGIAAKELSEAVYVACAYKDSNGTVWTSGVLGYSIGSYCSSQASKGGDIADLAKATAVYGYHAKQYFG